MLNTHNLDMILQLKYDNSNKSGQNRLEGLEILEMLWSVIHLISKTSLMTPDFFLRFNIHVILSFSSCSQSFKKICMWEILGAKGP